LLVVSSTQPEGAQVFGSVLVDNAENGNSTLEELFEQQLGFANFDQSGYYSILPNFVPAQDLKLFTKVHTKKYKINKIKKMFFFYEKRRLFAWDCRLR